MSRTVTRIVISALAALLLAAAEASAAPQPVVDGNRIVDAVTSKRFVPRGVNFPGFEYRCQQGWSYGEEGTGPGEVASTVAAMAAWKINTVRLPLNQDCWLGDDGLPDTSRGKTLTVAGYRQAVEDFVIALNAAGMVAIVDLHWSGPNGVVANGLRPMPDNRSAAFWHSVATRFKDNRSVIFDLFNEPHSRWNAGAIRVFGLSWDCWASGGCRPPSEPDTALVSGLDPRYQATGLAQLTATVRAAGATQPILLSGTDYANDLTGWLTHAPADDQLIAGFHNYPVQRCRTVKCWDDEVAPLAGKVPVLAAEIGQNDCRKPDHVNRFIEWADQRLIGYLAWAWWALPTLGCSNFALVSDLDGTPLPPVGTAFREHLTSLPDTMPEPPARTAPRLKIATASWNERVLRLVLKTRPTATKQVSVRIRLVPALRARNSRRVRARVITRKVRLRSGIARARMRFAQGSKPARVIARYPGDRLLKPAVKRRAVTSVSKVTR